MEIVVAMAVAVVDEEVLASVESFIWLVLVVVPGKLTKLPFKELIGVISATVTGADDN